MAKALRERVGKQYKGTQRTRKAVHGECTVELAKWTFPIISLCREPYEAKVSRTGLTGAWGDVPSGNASCAYPVPSGPFQFMGDEGRLPQDTAEVLPYQRIQGMSGGIARRAAFAEGSRSASVRPRQK